MHVKTNYIITILGIIVLSAITGCYNKKASEKNIFHYNEFNGISSLDPAFAKSQSVMWSAHQLFNTLVEIDDSLHIVPSVAKSWDVSPDRTIFTFHLRNDVFFHDDPCFPAGKGRKMNATDVVYSLSRIIDKELASPGAWIFNRKADSLQPFHAIDDTTFQLKLIR